MPSGIFGRRFRHGFTWYIRYTIAGQEIREKVGREVDGFTRSKAKDALRSRLGDIAQGKFRLPEVRRPVPFRDLVARYWEHAEAHQRAYRSARYTLNQLEAEFGTLALTELSAFRIEKWKLGRRKLVAAATVNRELNTLKAMLSYAVQRKLLDQNPAREVKGFKVDNARVRFLEPHELSRLLDTARADIAAAWLVPAITLAVHTGLRQGELLRLRWSDLAPTLPLATIPQTKNNEVKHVPLNAEAQAALATLPRVGATVLAWPWGDPVSDTTLYAAFRRSCAAAGITDFRWHDLRQELLGHKDPTMTVRYAHLSPAHKVAAVAKLSAALAAVPVAAPAQAAVNAPEASRAPADPARFRHAVSGRQTPAKRKYLEDRRLGKWVLPAYSFSAR
jgi:integrase